MITVCTSGYFNPLHKGHLKLLQDAKALGDYLIVIVNNDHQVALKGSKVFMDQYERMAIVQALRCVDHVVLSVDMDRTVCETLAMIRPHIFAKGGDSTVDNIPELAVCTEYNIALQLNCGGDKIQSSSWLKNAI